MFQIATQVFFSLIFFDFYCGSVFRHRIRLVLGINASRQVGLRPHLEDQFPTLHQLVMREVESGDFLPVETHLLHITVRIAHLRCFDFQALAIAQTHFHIGQVWRPYYILVAARANGVEAHGGEDVPRRHLAAVVVATQAVDVVLVEAVHDLAQPILCLVRL